jgi:hypothetical protein
VVSDGSQKRIAGVEVRQLERIFELLRERLPLVFEANRYFEERTGFHNEAGANNLVDALSHFSTLIEKADDLDEEGQAEQVALLEDHLRRSMMEAFEQVLKFNLSDAAILWHEYLGEVVPRLERGLEIPGATDLKELTQKREKIASLLEMGRQAKRSVSWEDWMEGTGAFAEACNVTDELVDELQAGLVSARLQSQEKRRQLIAAGAVAVALLVGICIGLLIF